MAEENNNALEFVDSDELVGELCRRHDTVLVLALRRNTVEDAEFVSWMHGEPHSVLGLLQHQQTVMLTRCSRDAAEAGD